jgi:hypothetical protein
VAQQGRGAARCQIQRFIRLKIGAPAGGSRAAAAGDVALLRGAGLRLVGRHGADVQDPLTHDEPATQSPSAAQLVRHASVPHRYGLQPSESCEHAPAPLQKPICVAVEPEHVG